MVYYIFFIIAFFNPFNITSNLSPIDLLPLIFFGWRMWRQNFWWYVLVLLFFLFRSVAQGVFFQYQSPALVKDALFSVMYIGACFTFTALFKDRASLRKFMSVAWKMGWILIVVILVSYLVKSAALSFYQHTSRLTWEPFGPGGPRFSAVFAFLGLLHLYDANERHPEASFRQRLTEVLQITPYLILCALGGTRVSMFALLVGVILHFRPSKRLLITLVGVSFLLPLQEMLQSVYSGFSRASVYSSRFVLWDTFYTATVSQSSTFWWGYGPGGIMLTAFGMPDAYLRLAHDLFLQIWFQYGLIMLVFAILYFVWMSMRLFQSRDPNPTVFAIFALVLLTELFDGTFSFTGCQWVFAASYGIIFLTISKASLRRRASSLRSRFAFRGLQNAQGIAQ